LHIIDTFPQLSSRFRHLGLVHLTKQLNAGDADAFSSCMLSNILEGLTSHPTEHGEKGSLVSKEGASNSQSSSTTRRTVNITTIKLLAEMLAGSGSIPTRTAIQPLRSVFDATNHIDVRTAVINDLLGIFRRGNDARAAYKTLAECAVATSESGYDGRLGPNVRPWFLENSISLKI
jgi:hypothetical protein